MLHPAPPQPTAAIRAGTGSPWPNRRTSGIAARCGSARIRVRRPRGGPFSSEEREEANQGAEDQREDRDDDQSEHEAEEAEAAARAQPPSVPADPQPTRLGPSRTPYRIRRIAAGIQTLADMNLPKEFPGRRMSGALRAIGRRSAMASGASPTGTTGASPRSDTGTVGPNPSPTGGRILAST